MRRHSSNNPHVHWFISHSSALMPKLPRMKPFSPIKFPRISQQNFTRSRPDGRNLLSALTIPIQNLGPSGTELTGGLTLFPSPPARAVWPSFVIISPRMALVVDCDDLCWKYSGVKHILPLINTLPAPTKPAGSINFASRLFRPVDTTESDRSARVRVGSTLWSVSELF